MEEQFIIVYQSQPDITGSSCYYINVILNDEVITTIGIEKRGVVSEDDLVSEAIEQYTLQKNQEHEPTI